MSSPQQVTLLGLGAMGSALAQALLKPSPTGGAPIELTIWNRTTTRPIIPTLTRAGATFQPSLSAALAASDTILVCLISYPAIYEALDPLGTNALHGKTVVNLSNGTPAEARQLATHMRDTLRVGTYVDGAVMATPDMVGTPASQIFLAGGGEKEAEEDEEAEAAALEPLKPLLARLGEPIYFGADPGSACVQDLANLAAMYGMFSGVITALALVKRHTGASVGAGAGGDNAMVGKKGVLGPGLPSMQRFVHPLLAEVLPLVDHISREWDEGIEEGGPHPLLMQQVALQNILRACEEEGVDGGALAYFAGKVEEAVREGGAEGSMTLVARKFVV